MAADAGRPSMVQSTNCSWNNSVVLHNHHLGLRLSFLGDELTLLTLEKILQLMERRCMHGLSIASSSFGHYHGSVQAAFGYSSRTL